MSVIANYLVNSVNPAVVGGVGTPVKYFADLPSQANPWMSGVQGVGGLIGNGLQGQTPTTTNNAGGLPVPGRNILNGQSFRIRASGNITFAAGDASGGAGTIVLQLSSAAAGASPSYSTIFSMTANQPLDGVTYPWTLWADLVGDSTSGLLQGTANSLFDGVLGITNGAITIVGGPITGINFAQEPAFVLVVGVTFPTSSAGNIATLTEFKIIQD